MSSGVRGLLAFSTALRWSPALLPANYMFAALADSTMPT